ncbi:RNA methyltransferase [Clostridium sp. AF15-31]|nr:RNA methyltransferase [Clostridium sp. AF15-31]
MTSVCIRKGITMKIIEVMDLNRPELTVYAELSERQLATIYEPEEGLFIAESPKVIERALDGGYEPVSFLAEKGQLAEAEEILDRMEDVPIYVAPDEILTKLTGYHLTRGLWCAMRRRTLPTIEEVCQGAKRIAILEEVVNPTNVGALFRCAAALGMDAVILTGGCSDPLYRRASRVSMGTVFQIPWTMLSKKDGVWPEQAMKTLKEMGFKTAAMALREDSVGIDDPQLNSEEKLAIVLGTEGDGLAGDTIADCDYTVMIPMAHGVDSLNVAAAGAVAFWQLGHQRQE